MARLGELFTKKVSFIFVGYLLAFERFISDTGIIYSFIVSSLVELSVCSSLRDMNHLTSFELVF